MKTGMMMGLAALLLATAASAQQAEEAATAVEVPGLTPPAVTVPAYPAQATAVPAEGDDGEDLATESGGGFGPSPGTPVLPMPTVVPPSAKPPPSRLVVRQGVNAKFGIALAHVNRIVTPFENVKVVTTSQASMTTEGPIVYVSTNIPEPIGLFVHDPQDPTVAVSLTLVPSAIQPVSTVLALEGAARRGPVLVSRNEDLAREFESGAPYVEAITSLMRDLAYGRVPDGYGLEAFTDAHRGLMPRCQLPGVSLTPGQLVSGAELMAIILRATNVSGASVEINEDGCSDEARATAAWPRRFLAPGESTEFYVVVGRPAENNTGAQRPSLVGVR
jgi:conjugal transfer pilus assembly protein TraK